MSGQDNNNTKLLEQLIDVNQQLLKLERSQRLGEEDSGVREKLDDAIHRRAESISDLEYLQRIMSEYYSSPTEGRKDLKSFIRDHLARTAQDEIELLKNEKGHSKEERAALLQKIENSQQDDLQVLSSKLSRLQADLLKAKALLATLTPTQQLFSGASEGIYSEPSPLGEGSWYYKLQHLERFSPGHYDFLFGGSKDGSSVGYPFEEKHQKGKKDIIQAFLNEAIEILKKTESILNHPVFHEMLKMAFELDCKGSYDPKLVGLTGNRPRLNLKETLLNLVETKEAQRATLPVGLLNLKEIRATVEAEKAAALSSGQAGQTARGQSAAAGSHRIGSGPLRDMVAEPVKGLQPPSANPPSHRSDANGGGAKFTRGPRTGGLEGRIGGARKGHSSSSGDVVPQ